VTGVTIQALLRIVTIGARVFRSQLERKGTFAMLTLDALEQRAPTAERFARLANTAHGDFMHRLRHLLDGFFINTGDALFESAYAAGHGPAGERHRQRCFALARLLHQHESSLSRVFLSLQSRFRQYWLATPEQRDEELDALHAQAKPYAAPAAAQFRAVLTAIAEAVGEGRGESEAVPAADLPVHPERLMVAFLTALRGVPIDAEDSAFVESCFQRFVLDRLGIAYGELRLHFRPTSE